VPPDFLKPGSENTISMSAHKDFNRNTSVFLTGGTTFSAEKKATSSGSIFGPSLNVFSPTKLLNDPHCLDPRLRAELPKSVSTGVSDRKDVSGAGSDDLSDFPGRQFGQYHMFLLVDGTRSPIGLQAKSTVQSQPLYIDVHKVEEKQGDRSQKENSQLQYSGTATIAASALNQRHIRLRLTGEADSKGPLSVKLALNDWRLLQGPLTLSTFPSTINGTGKRRFSVEAVAMSNNVDAQSAYAMIKISSNLVPLAVSNLRLEVEPLTAPALSVGGKRWF
jgi:hypothetical protein